MSIIRNHGWAVRAFTPLERQFDRHAVPRRLHAIRKLFAQDAEGPGPYFHPLLATLITGAARLMLAITERLIADHGLEWAFCDTDSMAIAHPDGMAADEFSAKVAVIVDWFAGLNPYALGGSILKIEDQNFALGDAGRAEPLYCWAVSSKRYALFNLAADESPVMRKVSAHGLGHLLAPYGADDPAPGIPTPHKSVLTDGIALRHSDLWFQIVSAALAGHPDQVDRAYFWPQGPASKAVRAVSAALSSRAR